MISIILPAYNEEDNIAELHNRILVVLRQMNEPFEIIIINDGSKDKTREEMLKLSPVKLIFFKYNRGQTAAIDAGIHNAKGDIIVIMDADLQNDPADIPRLLVKMREGYDVVTGWRRDRRDPIKRRLFSKVANWFTRKITGLPIHDFGCALRAFKREDMEGIHLYGVMHVFIPFILFNRGARVGEVAVQHYERQGGVSKYTLIHIFTDIADLLTIKFMYSYAGRPLVFFGGWGITSVFLGFLAVIVAIVLKIMEIRHFGQTPLPIMATLFIILGFILFMMGFIGELLIRIYYETRKETPYKIDKIKEIK